MWIFNLCMGLCDMQSQMSISLVCKSYIIYFVELLLLPCCPFSWVDNHIPSFRKWEFVFVTLNSVNKFLSGGRPRSTSINLLIQNSGKVINIGSKTTIEVGAGVRHFTHFVPLQTITSLFIRYTLQSSMHRNEDWPVFHKIVPIITVFEQNGRTRPLIWKQWGFRANYKNGVTKGLLKNLMPPKLPFLGAKYSFIVFF